MMVLGISILPKQNIQNGRMCAKDAIFVFQVFSVPSHISVSLSLMKFGSELWVHWFPPQMKPTATI
jgi:hypothetical protein